MKNNIKKILGLTKDKVHDSFNEIYFEIHRKEYDIFKYKNKYPGEKCFIIGNGPSLAPEDLDRIKKEGYVSFASNGIYSILDKTSWKPTYLTNSDPRFIFDEFAARQLQNIQADMYFLRNQYAFDVRNYSCSVCPLKSEASRRYLEHPQFSLDCNKAIYDIATVTYFSMQIAVYMGFTTLYLIGMDNRYAYSLLKDGTVVRNEGVLSHFFDSSEKIPDSSSAAPTWEMDIAYEYAEKFSREHGFRIYNATRGGFLEKFERVNFDEIVSN